MALHSNKPEAESSTHNILEYAKRSQCENRGTRLTEKRRQVLAGLVDSQRALSAYGLTEVTVEIGTGLYHTSHVGLSNSRFSGRENLVHRLNLAKNTSRAHTSPATMNTSSRSF